MEVIGKEVALAIISLAPWLFHVFELKINVHNFPTYQILNHYFSLLKLDTLYVINLKMDLASNMLTLYL